MKNDQIEINEMKTTAHDDYELPDEVEIDYSKTKPNPFTASLPTGSLWVALDPDVAAVFSTAEAVNSALREMIASTSRPLLERTKK